MLSDDVRFNFRVWGSALALNIGCVISIPLHTVMLPFLRLFLSAPRLFDVRSLPALKTPVTFCFAGEETVNAVSAFPSTAKLRYAALGGLTEPTAVHLNRWLLLSRCSTRKSMHGLRLPVMIYLST
jgi:hypothetical protein